MRASTGIAVYHSGGESMRAAAALALCVSAAFGQSAVPRFDVAAIRPSLAPTGPSGIYTGHGKVRAQNVTLKRCITGTYGLGPNQVFGGPGWMDSDRFEIDAKIDRDINDGSVLEQMFQALLADRFKLALHRETRTVTAYVPEVAKNGPKLEKTEGGESSTNASTTERGITLLARHMSLDGFAERLARSLDLPVVNHTGLEGAFNFKLEWVPERMKSAEGPSIFTALPEQLGLRLRTDKAPVEVLIIDHAEKPSEN
jgi:uncharacterized protein (TIGR03435 family)